MKKITLLFLLIFTVVNVYSQSMSMSKVNGVDAETFWTNRNNEIVAGETLAIELTYDNLPDAGSGNAGVRGRTRNDDNGINGTNINYDLVGTTGTATINFVVEDVLNGNASVNATIVLFVRLLSSVNVNSDRYTLVSQLTLDTQEFDKSKLDAYYKADEETIVLADRLEAGYSIYNLMGQKMVSGETDDKEIKVEGLKSGLYILATNEGSLKFVKGDL
ncbi:MAG: hypothetical protein ACON5F_06670 [Jejuia sp.]